MPQPAMGKTGGLVVLAVQGHAAGGVASHVRQGLSRKLQDIGRHRGSSEATAGST
jgi:hypothetical protein